MSDNAKLASTGAGAFVIGTTVITGWWLLAAAAVLVGAGAVAVRFAFRSGKSAGQR